MIRRCRLLAPVFLVLGSLALVGAPASANHGGNYGAPVITCDGSGKSYINIKICGDATTGAPAGVSLQWKKKSDWLISGWADDGTLCKLSLSGQPTFTGNAPGGRWELGAGLCGTIQVGDNLFDEIGASSNCTGPLECDTEYVFRSFAHASSHVKRSAWSPDLFCTTAPCDEGCTLTFGAWKTVPGAPSSWPVSSLTIGSFSYTQAQLLTILNTPVGGSCGPGQGANVVYRLARQLIAAMLNVAAGADNSCVQSAITAGIGHLGSYNLLGTPPCVGSSTALGSSMLAAANHMDAYNNGDLACADHCTGANGVRVSRSATPLEGAPTGIRGSSWGEIKIRYR